MTGRRPDLRRTRPDAAAARGACFSSAVLPCLGWLMGLSAAVSASAAGTPTGGDSSERFAWHAQGTWVEQETDHFHAPYAGPNSLTPGQGRETVDLTGYLGARLGSTGELWLNPEIDQGFGLDDTLGVAGFPSGEAYKVGHHAPYLRLPRAFVRETLNFSPAEAQSPAGPNQFAGPLGTDRLVLTVGKFGVADVFDVNRYAHDPRGDFLNWAVIDAGSFDYAADAWGYTVGLAVEWYTARWTWRAGFFDLSDVPNSPRLEPGAHEYQLDGEVEHRHAFRGHPGKLLLTVFESHARMARLADAIAAAGSGGGPVDPVPVRRTGKRDGVSLNFEQELTAEAGVFARAGLAGGNVETYEFTDIDRSVSAGISLRGEVWRRPADALAVALALNDISAARRRYLAAGGLGVLIGDGRLPHPGPEQILETYYQLTPLSWLQLTLDYQWIGHPAYNRDRGPVSVFALRLHAQF